MWRLDRRMCQCYVDVERVGGKKCNVMIGNFSVIQQADRRRLVCGISLDMMHAWIHAMRERAPSPSCLIAPRVLVLVGRRKKRRCLHASSKRQIVCYNLRPTPAKVLSSQGKWDVNALTV